MPVCGLTTVNCLCVCVGEREVMLLSQPGCIPSLRSAFPGSSPDSPWTGWRAYCRGVHKKKRNVACSTLSLFHEVILSTLQFENLTKASINMLLNDDFLFFLFLKNNLDLIWSNKRMKVVLGSESDQLISSLKILIALFVVIILLGL